MQQRDRMSMLKSISFIGSANMDIFDKYIPDHYDEIYSLYSLLRDALLDYNRIVFDQPKSTDTSFTFCCKMNKDDFSTLQKYIKDNSLIKYLKSASFKIYLNTDHKKVEMKFVKK